MVLTTNAVFDIRRFVIRELGLQDAGVAEDEARIELSAKQLRQLPNASDIAKNRRWIQKGLAMELVSASIMQHLDKPAAVTAWARPKDGRPNLGAGPGDADISVDFPETEQTRALKILAEVSAKEVVTTDDYVEQLSSALAHAQAELKKVPELLIYCLVVNGAKIHKDVGLHELFRGFLQKHSLTPDGNIRMVPMYSPDFGYIAGKISSSYDLTERYFEPYVLCGALDAVCNAIAQEELPKERMWMIDSFMNVVAEWRKHHRSGLDDELGKGLDGGLGKGPDGGLGKGPDDEPGATSGM